MRGQLADENLTDYSIIDCNKTKIETISAKEQNRTKQNEMIPNNLRKGYLTAKRLTTFASDNSSQQHKQFSRKLIFRTDSPPPNKTRIKKKSEEIQRRLSLCRLLFFRGLYLNLLSRNPPRNIFFHLVRNLLRNLALPHL